MPCSNCIDQICQGRCLPSREVMLEQLRPKIKPNMFSNLELQETDFIIKVYNKAFYFNSSVLHEVQPNNP
ncbi:hypothetical protein [Vibrio owensii]|uniref:hypothetical protein n=1 Tax=Vibrio harveyi group TaxID=717610 RepID=UPI003CC5F654